MPKKQDVCKNGHPRTPANLYKSRACRVCQSDRQRDNPLPKEKLKAYDVKRKGTLLDEIYTAYGDKCECCGETNRMFFNIDHINNDGAEDRKKGRHTHYLYRLIKKAGYPKDKYRILCYNCNLGRSRNGGVCPHLLEGK